jgi:glycerol-3-phosphate acyltransferase PlsX
MLIAVDAAGGENAPREIVKGAIKAAQEYGVDIALVGDKAVLHVLAGREIKKLKLQIIEAKEVIGPNEHPMRAVRDKPNSSIVIGVNMVKDGAASAFVSAGNTGAVLGAGLLKLGKIEGIERPALGSFLDITPVTPTLLIDAGANAECRPSHLLQFAQMGSTYVKYLMDIETPRVRLLSTGEEETKGNRLDIAKSTADVIVTDGFTGNIVLKAIEGVGDTFLGAARQVGYVVATAYHLRGRELLQGIGLGSWAKKADYREYGGACLLGVNGTIIVAHGRSQAKAIKNAIGQAKQTVERDICRIIREGNHEQTDSRN